MHIAMEVQEEWVNVFVQDNGQGIDEKDLPHLFDRFYRGDKARTRNAGGGFGLGLSIAQWIVVKHGGSITVKTKKGHGTTFTVALPISK